MKRTIEPLLRRWADLEVVTTAPVDEVVATVLRHVRGGDPQVSPRWTRPA